MRLALWLSAWLVIRYDAVVFVLTEGPFSNDFATQRMGWLPRRFKPLTRHLLNADPPDHGRLRRLVSKAFTPRAVERLPEQRHRFATEPDLTDSAIEELLRYMSPLDFAAFRLAREPVTIAGVTIPKGDVVLGVLGSANRDEARFKNPNTLDLARDTKGHLAFGAGAHFCLGAPLARMEGRIALTTLFRRFPDLRLGEPAEDVPWRRGLFFRGPARLRVLL